MNLNTPYQRQKNARLVFLFMVARGMVPAIDSVSYLTPITNKGKIIPIINLNSEWVYIVENFCTNHSNYFKTKNSITQQYKNSFL